MNYWYENDIITLVIQTLNHSILLYKNSHLQKAFKRSNYILGKHFQQKKKL